MKYFLDTEFIEGTQHTFFGKTKPTIDLISIGIVAEDGREYYAISKDFNLKEAWNRYDWKQKKVNDGIPGAYKVYWIRENVLKPIFDEWNKYSYHTFNYKNMKYCINMIGKSNKQIAEDIKDFVFKGQGQKIRFDNSIQFYGYYSDYDWVVFCWLFGKMIDLPKGFPMFAFDIQQQIEEYKIDKEQLLKEVPQISCHNALQDAIWNKDAYNWIQNKINNGT